MVKERSLKILVVGSGGREHALVRACLASPLTAAVEAAPGNGGMALEVTCHPVAVDNIDGMIGLCQRQAYDLVVVGPELPLSFGLADRLRAQGVAVYGPGADGALLEASKTHTKAFLKRYAIPTAAGEKFTTVEAALTYLKGRSFPIVIKASGLAAGKGVIIAQDATEAEATVKDMLEGGAFGESGHEILIEDFMEGEEASIMLMLDGQRYLQLSPSQDHKRIGDGDTGPNTGGMGAYAPAAVVDDAVRRALIETIIEPTLAGLKAEGIDYRGTLYIGIMITAEGPKVVEFNVRFGDPECQVLLPLLATDPVQLLYDCAHGQLSPETVHFHPGYAAVVVLAAGGYPGSYRKGDPIELPESLPSGVAVIHAGTKLAQDGKTTLTDGGRVLGVVARDADLAQALDAAYKVCGKITFADATYRRDIGHRELNRQRS